MKVAKRDEFELIERITDNSIVDESSVVVGVGDDCAVYEASPRMHQLISTDMMVEGIHFAPETMTYYDAGYRLGAANISDIAAMGGIPKQIVASIAMPKTFPETSIVDVYDGLKAICTEYDVNLIGGDTVSTTGPLTLSVTIIGEVPRDQAVLRSGAKSGDVVFISGPLGLSNVGLKVLLDPKLLETELKSTIPGDFTRPFAIAEDAHRRPHPQVECGIMVRQANGHALNDISDGLASELHEIAEASGVTIHIDESKLPIHPDVALYAKMTNTSPYDPMWYGGEDFQLVGTISENDLPSIAKQVTVIGKVLKGEPQVLATNPEGRERKILKKGYNHFSN